MKLAFIVTSFPVVGQPYIASLVAFLERAGHEVDIYARCDTSGDPAALGCQSAGRVSYFHVPRNRLVKVLKAIWLTVRHFPGSPIRILRAWNVLAGGKKVWTFNSIYYVVPFLRRHYDIVHCHFGLNAWIGALLKSVGAADVAITHIYGDDYINYWTPLGRNARTRLAGKSDAVLTLSAFLRAKMVALGCPPDRCRIHRVGIELEEFKFNMRLPASDQPVHLLTIGRLVEWKGHDYALRAVARLRDAGNDVRYTIVGGGPRLTSLQRLVRDLGLEQRVTFAGLVAHRQIGALYSSAHILVHPSITMGDGNAEGLGIVLLEALACGVPVVATATGGIPEIIVDGETGLLVPERDDEALARRIQYGLDHPEIWPPMLRRGRQLVEAEYNAPVLNRRLLEVYKELLQ